MCFFYLLKLHPFKYSMLRSHKAFYLYFKYTNAFDPCFSAQTKYEKYKIGYDLKALISHCSITS